MHPFRICRDAGEFRPRHPVTQQPLSDEIVALVLESPHASSFVLLTFFCLGCFFIFARPFFKGNNIFQAEFLLLLLVKTSYIIGSLNQKK